MWTSVSPCHAAHHLVVFVRQDVAVPPNKAKSHQINKVNISKCQMIRRRRLDNERETLPRVYGGTMLSPLPPFGNAKQS